jgi:neutral ceramidase
MTSSQALVGLAEDMVAGRPTTPSGATPPNLYDRQISFLPPVVLDAVPPGSHFGGVVQDVPEGASFTVNDTVQVKFR